VARIEELAARIEEARELRRLAVVETKALVNATLISVFEKQITSKYYISRSLPDVAEIARGKFAHRPRNEPRFYGGDIPFIQIGDISKSNRYIINHSQTLNREGRSISRLFPKGTIVIAITGATIGATGILTFDSCFPDSIVGIIANEKMTFPEFIYWALEYVKKAALEEATQTTQPNINLKNLEKLQIPLYSLSDQHSIVSYLDALQAKVDSLQHHQAETVAELDALLPSILDRAFRGEL
jgi:type I restriction enzyme, S subunit